MPRDIKNLPADLEKLVEQARADAAVEIHWSLQEKGPWWTGSFTKNWEISLTKVPPTKDRESNEVFPNRTNRQPPKKGKALRVGLARAIYVGNAVKYAAFPINRALINDGDEKVSYFQHGLKHTLTPEDPPGNYNWFHIYMKTDRLQKDINHSFTKKGFKTII